MKVAYREDWLGEGGRLHQQMSEEKLSEALEQRITSTKSGDSSLWLENICPDGIHGALMIPLPLGVTHIGRVGNVAISGLGIPEVLCEIVHSNRGIELRNPHKHDVLVNDPIPLLKKTST